MRQYFIQIALILAFTIAGTTYSSAGTQNAENATNNVTTEQSDKASTNDVAKTSQAPQSAKSHLPVEKAHSHIPSWDELAHIHHFHRNRLKKIKRHFKKSVFFAKLLLFVCHAAVLFISYLHVTH